MALSHHITELFRKARTWSYDVRDVQRKGWGAHAVNPSEVDMGICEWNLKLDNDLLERSLAYPAIAVIAVVVHILELSSFPDKCTDIAKSEGAYLHGILR